MVAKGSTNARAATRLVATLGGPFALGTSGLSGWVILVQPQLRFGTNLLTPDLAAWRRERLPKVPDVGVIRVAPDWTCDVLSNTTRALDHERKVPVYAREGVRHVWLIDYGARRLEGLRLHGARYVSAGAWENDAIVKAEPFDETEIDLSVLWAR
ncbi:hypothetical protein AKJ09_05179 [Labilithrix luteola]|uniref:Putative restriction endonuclease domain-containing protein n=1 Tax=Labilithrix luteola TaxID=1391654 RepID=A0A0K1PYA7_9BACT|nr:Uma2 family endonuclease [Labilithrix luteola]AKU98515.1 hypothetical protein AKJ09_05179 [Labilithrix luteola]